MCLLTHFRPLLRTNKRVLKNASTLRLHNMFRSMLQRCDYWRCASKESKQQKALALWLFVFKLFGSFGTNVRNILRTLPFLVWLAVSHGLFGLRQTPGLLVPKSWRRIPNLLAMYCAGRLRMRHLIALKIAPNRIGDHKSEGLEPGNAFFDCFHSRQLFHVFVGLAAEKRRKQVKILQPLLISLCVLRRL